MQYGFPSMFSQYGHSPLVSFLIHPVFSIAIHTIGLLVGLYYALKIDAKLLFLDENYNFKNDIIKPAVITGVIFAVLFLANALRSGVFLNYVQDPSFGVFELFINKLFYSLRTHLMMLLFGVCGLALLIKKVTKDVAMSIIMPISIGSMTIAPYVPVLYDSIMRGFSPNTSFLTSSLLASVHWLLIAVLFWKKGLETALLCDAVIVSIVYLIAPLVILALGA